MGRQPRDRHAERAAIQAATDRLIAGAPLRSASGRLTATELITESGLRRDVVYEHHDLIDGFKAQAKARNAVPEAMQDLADRNTDLKAALATAKADLAHERQVSAYLRRVVAELSIELDQTRQADEPMSTVTQLRPRPARQFHTRPG